MDVIIALCKSLCTVLAICTYALFCTVHFFCTVHSDLHSKIELLGDKSRNSSKVVQDVHCSALIGTGISTNLVWLTYNINPILRGLEIL
jgi:hypothetical protein